MIEIFGKSDCVYCDRAQELCRQHGLTFTYKSLDDRWDGGANITELKQRKPDVKTVPQIWWHDKYVGGFNDLVEEIENTRNFGQEKI